jgi:hypothetical protein
VILEDTKKLPTKKEKASMSETATREASESTSAVMRQPSLTATDSFANIIKSQHKQMKEQKATAKRKQTDTSSLYRKQQQHRAK